MRKLIKTTAVSVLILGAVSATTVPAQAGSEVLVGGLLGGAAGAGVGAAFGGGKGAAIGGILGLGLGAVVASAQADAHEAQYVAYDNRRGYDYNRGYDRRSYGQGYSRGGAPAPVPYPAVQGPKQYQWGYAFGFDKGYKKALQGVPDNAQAYYQRYLQQRLYEGGRPFPPAYRDGLIAGFTEGYRQGHVAARQAYVGAPPHPQYAPYGGGGHDRDRHRAEHHGGRTSKPYLHNEWDDQASR